MGFNDLKLVSLFTKRNKCFCITITENQKETYTLEIKKKKHFNSKMLVYLKELSHQEQQKSVNLYSVSHNGHNYTRSKNYLFELN